MTVNGDLRDLIQHPFDAGGTVVVSPQDSLHTAWQRMRQHDVSQLPVMDADRLLGILDESDILLHVYGDEQRFNDNVTTAMVTKLDRVQVTDAIDTLLPIFKRGHVAIVMQDERFVGLITQIDLLNWLRARV